MHSDKTSRPAGRFGREGRHGRRSDLESSGRRGSWGTHRATRWDADASTSRRHGREGETQLKVTIIIKEAGTDRGSRARRERPQRMEMEGGPRYGRRSGGPRQGWSERQGRGRRWAEERSTDRPRACGERPQRMEMAPRAIAMSKKPIRRLCTLHSISSPIFRTSTSRTCASALTCRPYRTIGARRPSSFALL